MAPRASRPTLPLSKQPTEWVQQQMHAALVDCLGRPIDWHPCAVHRSRYALPQAQKIAAAESFWWDAAQSLGVCGDFLGGSGAEGAWLSAQSLSAAMLQRGPDAGQTSPAPAAQNAAHQAVRHFAA